MTNLESRAKDRELEEEKLAILVENLDIDITNKFELKEAILNLKLRVTLEALEKAFEICTQLNKGRK